MVFACFIYAIAKERIEGSFQAMVMEVTELKNNNGLHMSIHQTHQAL